MKVKIADLTHNSDISRIANPIQKDIERTKKYVSTKKSLIEVVRGINIA